MRIAVAGGTGWTGKLVADALRAGGDEAVILARSAGVDLTTGDGLAEKLAGTQAVIDVTNITTTSAKASTRFFEAVTTRLLAAGQQAGVGHHLALSIVGVDRIDLGYYAGKRRQEELVLGRRGYGTAGNPAGTVLRATQFHEFAAQMLGRKGPVVIVPKMLSQPVALAEVAAHLVRLAHEGPAGMAPDLAGPEEHLLMQDMVRRLSRARHERRPVVAVGLPGTVGRQLAGGGLLPDGPGPRGTVSFTDWLERQRHGGVG
jgi:uncharacterized protein YbjT (DUF2867 family)